MVREVFILWVGFEELIMKSGLEIGKEGGGTTEETEEWQGGMSAQAT